MVMFVGQDEAIFKQFLFLSKMWIGPNGERPLLPKDEGTGLMISAFICRELGLIRELENATLETINANRLGCKYKDEEAAIVVNGFAEKKPLSQTLSPFLVYFEYGESREGYWDYNRMVLQFEDVVDCLKVMKPEWELVFLFDHSSGHSKQRPDGLNSSRMNKGFGGKCPIMRTTLIQKESGYLGPFNRKINVGEEQHLVFQPGDEGPFWMSENERNETRHDIPMEQSEVERYKADLTVELGSKGISTKGKNKRELIELCNNNGISTVRSVQKIKEGWEGKAKGLLQVLWERGFIDMNNLSSYTLTGKKDAFGVVDLRRSLRNMMSLCDDFLNEEGMLQCIGKNLDVMVILTPKCHAELAGEGIEYMWALSKGAYRNLTLAQKKGKENFATSVRHCLSSKVVSLERIRKFGRRAHQYLIAYHCLDGTDVSQETRDNCLKFGPVALEKLITEFKTHRCAFDFDYKFVKAAMNQ